MLFIALVSSFHALASAVRLANTAFLSGNVERYSALKQTVSSSVRRSRPNILYVLADDWGWSDAGWHKEELDPELRTPNMDKLVKEGVELNRHYVASICSPTRAAVQTGRNPIYVNAVNHDHQAHNPEDAQGGYAGIPRDMTGIAEKMRHAEYATYMYGKWDAGMATPYHTPYGRGYEKTLSYFRQSNGFWNHEATYCKSSVSDKRQVVRDLWGTTEPGRKYINPYWCSQENQQGCLYEDQLFTNLVVKAIEDHAEQKEMRPFFIFWAPHLVHAPLEVPDAYLNLFSDIDHEFRRKTTALLYFMDEALGHVTNRLKDSGLWNNTLVVVHADNGAVLYRDGKKGAGNNFPLKGGKATNWEGGVRVNAFVTGGLLPESVRGTKQNGLMAGWDWYATFAYLAGVDAFDSRAAERGLPPQETYNLWPLISGETTESPRYEIALGSSRREYGRHTNTTLVGALIRGRYKLVIGWYAGASWSGPTFPNTTKTRYPAETSEECGTSPETGCLYDLYADPTEHENIASIEPDLFMELLQRSQHLEKNAYNPERGLVSPKACEFAIDKYDGFFGPFVGANEATWVDARNRYGEEAMRAGL